MRRLVKAAQRLGHFLTDIRGGVRDGFAYRSAPHEGNYSTTVSPKTRPVLTTSTLTGNYVRNPAGDDPVSIEDFKLDLESGRIAYALLSKISDEILAENALDYPRRDWPFKTALRRAKKRRGLDRTRITT